MAVLKGIGEAIGSLFGVEPKKVDENLEDKINKALAEEREKIRPSREDIDWFSWVTKDNNPIHRLEKRAKKLGFEDIPIMGAHVAAYGEQYVEGVVSHMRNHWGADIKIVGQENKYSNPLYPGERVLWQVNGYKSRNGKIRLDVDGSVKDKRIVKLSTTLGKEYPLMPQISGPVFSDTYLLDSDHLEAFYNCVGGKKASVEVPNMLPASYMPATLLTLLERKTQTVEGMNLLMRFDFMRKAIPGKLQVDIFPPERDEPRASSRYERDENGKTIMEKDEETGKERLKRALDCDGNPINDYTYVFRAVVSQKTEPIIYGEIMSSVPFLIEF